MNITFVRKAMKGGERPGHKYIRRIPDGKGGWDYIYEEPKIRVKKPEEVVLPRIKKPEPQKELKIPQAEPESHDTTKQLEAYNVREMKLSDDFFNLSSEERAKAVRKGVSRLSSLAQMLFKKGINSEDKFKDFVKQNEEELLSKYFGLTKREFKSESGTKFSNYILTSFSDDGYYVTFNYADKFFFDSINREYADNRKPKWSMPMRIARGITIDMETGQVVSMPYEKFFNMDEYIDGKIETLVAKVNSQQFTATEKVDGILIQGFYDARSDSLRLGTRKRLSGEHKEEFTTTAMKLIKSGGNYEQIKNYAKNNRASFVFELIDPKYRVVVGYGAKKALVLHGIRDLRSFNILPWEETKNAATSLGLESPDTHTFNSFEELADFQKNYKKDVEGFVLRFEDGSMIKAKTEAYFDKLKGLRSLSYGKIADSILKNEDWNLFKYNTIKSEELFDLADKYRTQVVETSNKYSDMMGTFVDAYISTEEKKSKEEMMSDFQRHYNSAVRSGLVNPDKVSAEDFRVALSQLANFYITGDKTMKDRYNKNLMKIVVKQLRDSKWMGAKLQEQELLRSYIEASLMKGRLL